MQYLIYVVIFSVGVIIGFLVNSYLKARFFDYNTSGTILVSTDPLGEKLIYSLVLDEDPEQLRFKELVIFKVDASVEENGDRD
jgi:hypothetical protein